jgi:hypothetical protein
MSRQIKFAESVIPFSSDFSFPLVGQKPKIMIHKTIFCPLFYVDMTVRLPS